MRQAFAVSEELIAALGTGPAYEARKLPDGTSVFLLRPRAADPQQVRQRLAAEGIHLPPPQDGVFWPRVNETLGRASATAVADALQRAALP